MNPHADEQLELRASRRNVVRSAAWTVPVIAVATTAPAYAASLCSDRSSVVSTTNTTSTSASAQGWSRTNDTSGSWRTNDPDTGTVYSNARIAVSESKTGLVEYGFAAAANNLIAYTTGGVTGITINQRPTATTSARGYAQRTETTFNFQRLVYNLSFTIADVSKVGPATGGTNGFWDAVWVESDGVFTSLVRDADVIGSGTSSTDPFTPRDSAPDVGDTAPNNVTLQFNGRCTYVKLYYWSATKPGGSSGGGQGITVGNMSMQLAPDGCV